MKVNSSGKAVKGESNLEMHGVSFEAARRERGERIRIISARRGHKD
jgi:uncharacterized DUF497 family protein